MTGPEHYREAEKRLEASDYQRQGDYDDAVACAMHEAAVAQVHATLALAAAYAEVNPTSAWHEVAGQPVPDLPVIHDQADVESLAKLLHQIRTSRRADWSDLDVARGLLEHGVRLPEVTP